MRRIYPSILLFFALPSFTFGQSIEELNKKSDSLNMLVKQIDAQIDTLSHRKFDLKREIAEINQKKNKLEWEEEAKKGIRATINFMGGILRDKPNTGGNEIAKVPPGDTILILNWYEEPYFKAVYKEKSGYISLSSLSENDKINMIINKNLPEKDSKAARLTSKYGNYTAQRILNGEYWIGMTPEMAVESLGRPDDINRSTGSWGVHEQWVYKKRNIYLYFENGNLASIQD